VSQFEEDEGEIVDGLPVVAASRSMEASRAGGLTPARQAAALAATGFVAGAATVAVVHRRRTRVSRRRRKSAFGDIMASNSFLIDVHLLKR
jgi:hypothetical protein